MPKPNQEPTLITTLRGYLNEDCFIDSEPEDENYEFVFRVKYPKIKDKEGNGIGNFVAILKPKNRNSIEFVSKIILHKDALETFKAFDANIRHQIVWEIFIFLINQNLTPLIPENMEISFRDKLYFLDSEFPSINEFYHSIIKVTNSSLIVLGMLNRNLGILINKNPNSDSKDSYFQ